jgi:hypothetical protein
MRWKDGHACWESLKPRGHGLCESVIPAFAFRDWGKPWKTSVGIAGSLVQIRTSYVHTTKRYRHTNLAGNFNADTECDIPKISI